MGGGCGLGSNNLTPFMQGAATSTPPLTSQLGGSLPPGLALAAAPCPLCLSKPHLAEGPAHPHGWIKPLQGEEPHCTEGETEALNGLAWAWLEQAEPRVGDSPGTPSRAGG
ncbi:coiled-coil domain-containing protein 159-like [Platysternon megacephalum]|uniref:Coiled-coil domain-containing protein 159-like n=1 Tax=Platysternon megacephalum TaxID=55544 RepID=A0A4D9E796_9SAUR|nr:coiled-coil domain-containing protein 159-like [Platysternon megacephalum]